MRRSTTLLALAGLGLLGAWFYSNDYTGGLVGVADPSASATVDMSQGCSNSISNAALEELSSLIRLRGQWCPSACGGSVDPQGNTSTQRRFVVSCRFGAREQNYRVGLGRDAVGYTVGKY